MANKATSKKRLIVLTDISSTQGGIKEPDDAQSFVRLLLYANEFDIEGLIATYTSHWDDAKPMYLRELIEAYGRVHTNLLLHDSRYPTKDSLLSLVKIGNTKCGIDQIGEGKDTEGSNCIIDSVDRDDLRPVWITIWGAPTDLAQALWRVSKDRTPKDVDKFISKIRVYSIGDQYDASGPWIRKNYTSLFYITAHLSFRGMYRGGNSEWLSGEWLELHITREHGSLGKAYPIYDGADAFSNLLGEFKGIKEGDTPSFLYLVDNGLTDVHQPEWGSWGGRFLQKNNHAFDAMDTYEGITNELATVYRWRQAYQADFQARMDWCVNDYEHGNHAPIIESKEVTYITVSSGELVSLDAGNCYDPDGDHLYYSWFYYYEPSTYKGNIAINGENMAQASFIAPKVIYSPRTLHIILTVKDDGIPSLSSYQRIVVTVIP